MYLIDTQVTINWEIMPYAAAPVLADLHLVVIDPNNISRFLESPVDSENYIPPTETTNGQVFYRITPDIPGLWKTGLVIGSPDNYQLLSEVDMFVFGRVHNTPNYRVPIGGEELLIEWLLTQWDNVEGELGFWEWDEESAQWVTTSEDTSAGFFIPINGWNAGYRKSYVRVIVSSLGSGLPNELTTLTITDGGGTILAFKEVLPSTTPAGYVIDEVMYLSYPTNADIAHLVIRGSRTIDHNYTDDLSGFLLTSRPYVAEVTDSVDVSSQVDSVELRPLADRYVFSEAVSIGSAVNSVASRAVVTRKQITEAADILPAVELISKRPIVIRVTVPTESVDIEPDVLSLSVTPIVIRYVAPAEHVDILPAVDAIRIL